MNHTVLLKSRRLNYMSVAKLSGKLSSLFSKTRDRIKVRYEQFVNLRQRGRGKGFGGARPNIKYAIFFFRTAVERSRWNVGICVIHIYVSADTHALFAIFGISKLHLCERKRLLAYTHIHSYLVTWPSPWVSVSSYLFLIIVRDVEYNFALGQLTAGNADKPTGGNKRPFTMASFSFYR